MAKKTDIYEQVTNQVISLLEDDTIAIDDWQMPWQVLVGAQTNARHNAYQGINQLILMMTANIRGYKSPYWFTFNQVKKMGLSLNNAKGQGVKVVFYKPLQIEDKDTGEQKKIPLIRSYTVFNGDLVEGLPEQYIPIKDDTRVIDPIDDCEKVVAQQADLNLTHGIDQQPRYNIGLDCIYMPQRNQFLSQEAYYATLFHELVHWTMNESRCNRKVRVLDKKEYAFEELVAELGSAFICNMIGISSSDMMQNNTSYIKGWLSCLKADKKYIFKAAQDAQKAANFVLQLHSDYDMDDSPQTTTTDKNHNYEYEYQRI